MGINKRSPIKAAQPKSRDGPDLVPYGVMGCHHDISISRITEPSVTTWRRKGMGGGRGGRRKGRGGGRWCRDRSGNLSAQEHAYRALSNVKVTEQKVSVN